MLQILVLLPIWSSFLPAPQIETNLVLARIVRSYLKEEDPELIRKWETFDGEQGRERCQLRLCTTGKEPHLLLGEMVQKREAELVATHKWVSASGSTQTLFVGNRRGLERQHQLRYPPGTEIRLTSTLTDDSTIKLSFELHVSDGDCKQCVRATKLVKDGESFLLSGLKQWRDVPTRNKHLPGVGLAQRQFESVQDELVVLVRLRIKGWALPGATSSSPLATHSETGNIPR
jgi:hypothetical protein